MDVSIGERWETFVQDFVRDGRFESADDVVAEGLRLLQAREAKQDALKKTLEASIARGGSYTDDEIGDHIDAMLDDWERKKNAA